MRQQRQDSLFYLAVVRSHPMRLCFASVFYPREGLEMFCCAFLWQSRQPTVAPSKVVEELKQGSARHRTEAGTDGRFTISAVDESESALREFQSVARSAIRAGAVGNLKIHVAHRARGTGGLYDYLVLSP
jgi:hypothetical protein